MRLAMRGDRVIDAFAFDVRVNLASRKHPALAVVLLRVEASRHFEKRNHVRSS
jgi:hypothetical protein